MEIWTLPDKYQNRNQNFHCDEPLHGYGCFHLDKKKPKKLKEAEWKELQELQDNYYVEDRKDLERLIAEATDELLTAENRVAELEGELDDFHRIEELMEKAEDD